MVPPCRLDIVHSGLSLRCTCVCAVAVRTPDVIQGARRGIQCFKIICCITVATLVNLVMDTIFDIYAADHIGRIRISPIRCQITCLVSTCCSSVAATLRHHIYMCAGRPLD